MKLFSNGCSYTWGGGLYNLWELDNDGKEHFLDYYNDSPKNIDRLESVYPHHLGNLMKAEKVYNLSMGGGSNDRIVRTTLDFFHNLMINGKNVRDYFVTIQWTDPYRSEFYDTTYTNSWVGIQHGYSFSPAVRHSKELDNIKDYYYKFLNSDRQTSDRLIQHITLLGEFFKHNKIPYVFFTHVDIFGTDVYGYGIGPKNNDLIVTENEKKIQLIDKRYVWWNGSSRKSVMSSTKFDAISNSHPSRLGHKQWAGTIHRWLLQQKLIQ